MSQTLKRYTELPYVLHMLQRRELALLSPALWDDRNDALYMERYKQRANLGSVHVLCLTEASTTYHHWKIFAGSTSGVCIEFDRESLIRWADKNGLQYDFVRYMSLRRARQDPPNDKNLPFRKRHAFRHEEEFRLLYSSPDLCGPVKTFKLDLSTIDHIEINPWLPEDVFESVKQSIQAIRGCGSLVVEKSHMLTNAEWAGMPNVDA